MSLDQALLAAITAMGGVILHLWVFISREMKDCREDRKRLWDVILDLARHKKVNLSQIPDSAIHKKDQV
jgi:hypothetical protein